MLLLFPICSSLSCSFYFLATGKPNCKPHCVANGIAHGGPDLKSDNANERSH